MTLLKKIGQREFWTYLIVGAMTAVIYFGIIALNIEVFKIDYRVGVTIAYVVAVSFHFAANRKFTFRVADVAIAGQGLRYSGVLVINYLITLAVVFLFVGKLGMSTYLGAAISIFFTVGFGYIASKFWVFSKKG